MLVAFSDHDVGNSTSGWKNASPPSLKFGMRASRRSHSSVSYGSTPDLVQCRSIPIPSCCGAIAIVLPLPGNLPGPNVRFLPRRIRTTTYCGLNSCPPRDGGALHHCSFTAVNSFRAGFRPPAARLVTLFGSGRLLELDDLTLEILEILEAL